MKRDDLSLSALQPPTRVRYGVLGFACALSMITYLDRVCIASAVPEMLKALDLTSVAEMKLAFTAFAFAYAAFEIPSGWLGDVFGPRLVLIRIVLWWSVFTALTGATGLTVLGLFVGLPALIVIRFLFGIGEAGAYPNITRALHNWFPFHERGLAQGSVWMAGRLMGGLTPLLWWLLVVGVTRTIEQADGSTTATVVVPSVLTWRQTFWLFGALGIAWCVLFAVWFRNRPEQKATVNEAELKLIQAGRADTEAGHAHVPWLKILGSRNLWLLCLMYFCGSYGWYFNITYLPTFLEEQYKVDPSSWVGALYKGGPLWMGAIACLGGGWLTDLFIRRTGNRKWGRRLFGVVGHGLCALCYLLCPIMPSAFAFFMAISLAAFWNDLTMGSAWATCQDIGKRYAAIVAGCMNTVGNMGGAVAGWSTGMILQGSLNSYAATHGLDVNHLNAAQKALGLVNGYNINFITFTAVYLIAVLLWLGIDSTKPIETDAA
jgi:MFS family permease